MLQDAQFEAESLEQEIAIMKKVKHPNCIKLHEVSARNEFKRPACERRGQGAGEAREGQGQKERQVEGVGREARGCLSLDALISKL